jgi:predicted O-methyltransferase YrrM
MGKLFNNLFRSIAKDFAQGFAQFPFSRSADYLRGELKRRAMMRSADFVEDHMPDALFCQSKLDHMDCALSQKGDGLILEFGVYKGTTINFIAKRCPDEKIYGFDSFEGLPEHWAGNRYSKRNFDRKGKAPKVENNVELVVGWFDETLPTFLKAHEGPVGFLHIDCDIYSSTRQVFELLGGRIGPGCIVVFDEFFNYHGFEQHEYKAFFELANAQKLTYEFTSYSGQEAAVRITGKE